MKHAMLPKKTPEQLAQENARNIVMFNNLMYLRAMTAVVHQNLIKSFHEKDMNYAISLAVQADDRFLRDLTAFVKRKTGSTDLADRIINHIQNEDDVLEVLEAVILMFPQTLTNKKRMNKMIAKEAERISQLPKPKEDVKETA